jgi:transcription initiation factor TFIID TATA-box-binding protein
MQEQDPLNGATRILMLKWGLLLVDVRDSIRIENVVASATLDQKINLDSVVKGNPGVEYDPKTFPGLVYKIKRPKTSILIFRTGKMVCTGAKSSKEANKAVKKVVREMKKSGIIIPGKPKTKIVNIVASGNLGGLIDLERCAYSLGRTMYEPEQFPGLIYRVDSPKVVFLIFASGKIVCTGARKEEDVYRAVEDLHQDLEKYDLIYYS